MEKMLAMFLAVVMTFDMNTTAFAQNGIFVDLVEVKTDTAPQIINGRTFVPLRFISEAVGYTVDYIAETADVYLFSSGYMMNQEGEGIGETPSGVWDDGICERPSGVWDDGIGEVTALSYEERVHLLEQTTNDWVTMTDAEKEEVSVMIARWWEDYEGYIVEDYEYMVAVLDHQMDRFM